MNREIKFIAWDIEEKQIIVPNFINNSKPVEGYVYLQYTGLKDKNGKEIYEGDILEFVATKTKWIVSYSHGAFVISYQNSNINILYDCSMENGKLTHMKIIGNIYESPELLESEAEQ